MSVVSLVFIVKTINKEVWWQEEMLYYKVYFAFALILTILQLIVFTFYLPQQLMISFILYFVLHIVLLCALVEKARRKETAYISGVFIFILLSANYVWGYDDRELRMIYIVFTLIYFSFLVYVSIQRAREEKNNGYYIFTLAFFSVLLSSVLMIKSLADGDMEMVNSLSLAGNNMGFVLVVIGFLSLILVNEHKKLSLLATKDTLTGMNNRRGLQMMLDAMIPLSNRNNRCLSIITIDIDFFKKINDTYGHDGGDIVLKDFAELIMKSHRKSDISCRLGGEEFVLVLPDTGKEGANIIAEKLRQNTESLDINLENKKVKITASFGVATNCSNIDVDAMLKDADKALYTAKSSGRNQVCHIDDN
jgi:diguanylate cyclase (GGDEF)-like protein